MKNFIYRFCDNIRTNFLSCVRLCFCVCILLIASARLELGAEIPPEKKNKADAAQLYNQHFLKSLATLQYRNSMGMTISNEEFVADYALSVQRYWKAHAWYRIKNFFDEEKETNQSYGGGLQNPLFVVGNFYEYGLYGYFGDISKTQAWDNHVYQSNKWGIRTSPVDEPAYGARLSVPVTFAQKFSSRSWNPIIAATVGTIPDEDYGDSHFWGGTAGYSFGRAALSWQPYLMYRYSVREQLPLTSSAWEAWAVKDTSNLELSQLLMSQKIILAKYLVAHVVGVAALSDTQPMQFAGSTQLKTRFSNLEISAMFNIAEKNAVYDEWKYYNHLWSTSSEILWFYTSGASIKVRGEIAEYNIKDDDREFPQSLKKYYGISWRHKLNSGDGAAFKTKGRVRKIPSLKNKSQSKGSTKANAKKSSQAYLLPKMEYGYSYSEYDEYYKNFSSLVWGHGQWKHEIKNNMYWYIDEESRLRDKTEMTNGFNTSYSLVSMPLVLGYKLAWNIDWKSEYHNKDFIDGLYDRSNSLEQNFSMRYRIHRFYFSSGLEWNLHEDTDINDYKAYKHDMLTTIKIRYN